jgi:ribose transport system substrate-binding protein
MKRTDRESSGPAEGGITRRQAIQRGSAAAAGLALFGMFGCTSSSAGGTTAAGGKQLKGMSHYIANVLAFEAMNRAFGLAVTQLGGKPYQAAWDGADQQTLLSQVQTFPSLGVNAVHSFTGADAVVPQYAQFLTNAGVFYQNLANRLPWFSPSDPKFNGRFLGTDGGSFAEEGYVMGKVLFERGDGVGEAIILRGTKGSTGDTERQYGLNRALKEFPDVKVVASAYTDFDTSKAQQALAQLLPAFKKPKFVVCLNDGVAVGALAALRAAGNKTALVNGFDGDPPFLQEMQRDERVVGTSAGLIAFSGVLAAVHLYDALNGVKRDPLEDFINTDSLIIDSPAAAKALLDLTGPDKPIPWDPRKMSRHLMGDKWEMPHKIEVADPGNFDWGDRPGVYRTPRPKGFTWPEAYQAALDAGGIDKTNQEWATHYKDVYADIRKKDHTAQTSVLGTFARLGIA